MTQDYEIVEISKFDKKRYKVSFTDGSQILLYYSEIRAYQLEDGVCISKDVYEDIQKILFKRAKERSFYILKSSDKTVKQLQDKLRDGLYPEKVIADVIEFLKEYSYLDDERYSRRYISMKSSSKSIRQISSELALKGISKETIQTVLQDDSYGDIVGEPRKIIYKLLKQKKYQPENDDKNYKSKIIGFLMRKGFDYEDISSCMKNFKDQEEYN